MKTYQARHSEMTTASPADVWKHWADLSNWPTWDEGVEEVVPKGRFEPGHTFMLKPKGAPQAIEVTLVEVVPNERFVDETRLPFGTIRATHTIERMGDRTQVCHTIEAEITPEHTGFFEQAIWSGMEQGVVKSVRNLTARAEGKKTT
jgi:hypothetical protein